MKLIYTRDSGNMKRGQKVMVGDFVITSSGETGLVNYCRPPSSPASEGKVSLSMGDSEREYYVSVIGAKWIEREDREDMEDSRIKTLEGIRELTFNVANTLAIEGHGVVAGEMHEASNRITNAIRMLKEGVTKVDSDKQIQEWATRQLLPVSKATLQALQEIDSAEPLKTSRACPYCSSGIFNEDGDCQKCGL